MKKLFPLILGLVVLALASTSNLSAQTIGGDTALNSKTWTWTGLTAALPQTTLLTPTQDADLLISVYVTIQDNTFSCVQPLIQYTDQFGPQVQSFLFPPATGANSVRSYNQVSGGAGVGAMIQIHAAANTPVSISADNNACGNSPTPTETYDLVVSKIKVNP